MIVAVYCTFSMFEMMLYWDLIVCPLIAYINSLAQMWFVL